MGTHDGTVTAIATVALVGVTAYYAWYTRRLVREAASQSQQAASQGVQMMQRLDSHLAEMKRLADFQGAQLTQAGDVLNLERLEYQRREADKVRAALISLWTELSMDQEFKPPYEGPLLDAQFNPNAWALSARSATRDTQSAVAKAYLAIRRYNKQFDVMVETKGEYAKASPRKSGEAMTGLMEANKRIGEAIAAMQSDAPIRDLVAIERKHPNQIGDATKPPC